ncbi:uncharacterized protein [Leptinotarsa decemlineata]|uniref:uncharacterized protein n=1 Tax=Leptinotarsa decemlineata TaxID=7539 RepID=UPI003D30AD22
MLNISPFSYGLQVKQVYDSGTIFAAAILDIKREDLREKFLAGVANLAAICLSIGYPTTVSAPHSIANRFKNLLAIAVAKISKVTIEIINDVHTLKPGDKVGATEATLLNMLNISPFSYGLQGEQVYDSGTIFAAAILDIKREDLREKFLAGVANLAAVCWSIGYPTTASAPHSIANRFKNLLAIAVAEISKVTIEIINNVHILKPGDKVGATEATLLNMLNISPFSYGLQVEQVYDSGTIFAAAILDIKREDLREKFLAGVANLAAHC